MNIRHMPENRPPDSICRSAMLARCAVLLLALFGGLPLLPLGLRHLGLVAHGPSLRRTG